jgi:hypothetical protein
MKSETEFKVYSQTMTNKMHAATVEDDYEPGNEFNNFPPDDGSLLQGPFMSESSHGGDSDTGACTSTPMQANDPNVMTLAITL